DYARRSEEEYNRLTQQQPPKAEKPAPAPQPEQPAPAPKTGWKQENGMWYFYNTDGSMATGWLQNNGSWYYLNANGSMAT
ncbi:cell surface protein, partial [Streptococcus pneumoniae]|nr:cell surface protein [Streptococcus pneumoniae]MDG8771149.1 cell surface protein [Streptococcus pneumoniae]